MNVPRHYQPQIRHGPHNILCRHMTFFKEIEPCLASTIQSIKKQLEGLTSIRMFCYDVKTAGNIANIDCMPHDS